MISSSQKLFSDCKFFQVDHFFQESSVKFADGRPFRKSGVVGVVIVFFLAYVKYKIINAIMLR